MSGRSAWPLSRIAASLLRFQQCASQGELGRYESLPTAPAGARGEKMVDTPGAEAPTAPDITHENPASEEHLAWPSTAACAASSRSRCGSGSASMECGRFSFSTWSKHFLLDRSPGRTAIVGGYLSLVYLTPVIGGWLADYYLGSKRSVKWGALVMAVGYLLLCFGRP